MRVGPSTNEFSPPKFHTLNSKMNTTIRVRVQKHGVEAQASQGRNEDYARDDDHRVTAHVHFKKIS